MLSLDAENAECRNEKCGCECGRECGDYVTLLLSVVVRVLSFTNKESEAR